VLLAAVVVVTAFLVRDGGGGGGDQARASTPTSTPTSAPRGALTGDVDGDGAADIVSLSRGDLLRVRLGSGVVRAHLLEDRPRLEGLADVGGHGLAVVVSESAGGRSRQWSAWIVRDDRLVALRTHGQPARVSWLAGRRWYAGTPDPLQQGDDHVVVVARRWTLRSSARTALTGTRAGLRCWDRVSPAPPRRCRPGQDWRFDVGPHADLPRLLPTVRPAWANRSSTSFAGGVWKVHNLDPNVDPEAARYDVSHTSHGVTQVARVPVGWPPALFGFPVRIDHAPGLLLSQEGGDSDTWHVYVVRGGRLQPLPMRGPLPLGGGFTQTSAGQSAYYSWLTPRGRLFTRVGTGQSGRYRVYAWLPTGGGTTSPPTLVAHGLGVVCLDETLDTYGTCS
jgi:hypothetical protein